MDRTSWAYRLRIWHSITDTQYLEKMMMKWVLDTVAVDIPRLDVD